MKSFLNSKTRFNLLKFFGLFHVAVCIGGLLAIQGCFPQYYQTNTVYQVNGDSLRSLTKENKYFVFHANNYEYALKDIKVNDSSIEGNLDSIMAEHGEYLHPRATIKNPFPSENAEFVLDEVHLYADPSITYSSPVNIPFKDLRRMDVYGLDVKNTNKARTRGTVGAALIIVGTIGITIAAIEVHNELEDFNNSANAAAKSISCSPQVFVEGEKKAIRSGTLCSGAIYASLEREDWLPVMLNPNSDGLAQVMIKGAKNEELQFDNLRLIQLTHRQDGKVLIDRHGKMLTISNTVMPSSASIGNGIDQLKKVSFPDKNYYSFNNHPANGLSGDLIMDFKKPVGAGSGKLLISAKNSAWAYYVFNQYKRLYGEYYNDLIRKKDSADPAKVMQCELDQYLPILVSIRKGTEWKYLDFFPTSGTTEPRDLVMNLDLSGLEQNDHVQVRLQTAYLFWDLDYAAMDFSPERKSAAKIIEPLMTVIRDESGTFREAACQNGHISFSDREELIMEYRINPTIENGMRTSYFLAGKGYYHDQTHYPGKPNLAEIARFSGKGAFDRYSRKKMEELQAVFVVGNAKNTMAAK